MGAVLGGRDFPFIGAVFHPGATLPWLKLPGCSRHLHLHIQYRSVVLPFQQSSGYM